MGLLDNFRQKNTTSQKTKTQKATSKVRFQSRPMKRPSSKGDDGAKVTAREIIFEAREEAFMIKKVAEDEAAKARVEALAIEKRLAEKEESIDRKLAAIDTSSQSLSERSADLEAKFAEVEKLRTDLMAKLEKIAGVTHDEARNLILQELEKKLVEEKAKLIKEAEDAAKASADAKVKQILADAMVAGATDYVAEFTTSTVILPSEEMKGRIIGKEGRNIRTFETVTGVDVNLDTETPNEIILSSFDPVRREKAKVTLEQLIRDGRIQPTRIEEIYKRVSASIDKVICDEGAKLCHELGVYGLPGELVCLSGRFKYRFSYGQNLIAHTLEETKIGVKIAQELGADVETVRLGCLLHDIGKVVTDREGTHVQLGVELAKKHNLPEAVTACIAEHHQDYPFTSVESAIVFTADAISGSRPGARHEPVEEYIKRMTKIEQTAQSFEGVGKAYALSAGRDLRVYVEPEKIDDATVVTLSHDIARKLEQEIPGHPGQIKVTVIREIRASDTAS